jgi:hypothetical protein
VAKLLQDNLCLKPKLKETFHDAYYAARLKAVRETNLDESMFAEKCEWKLHEILPKP